jgi:glycosyltransferase domain-containing protein
MSLVNLDLTLMQKLTIIIPTYKRHAFVIRAMQYWSGKGAKIIFIDGSKTPLRSTFLNHAESNIRYIHKPTGLYERLFLAISLIDTEYVMLGCDDEFYIPSALNSCLVKLSLDAKLVACSGRAVGFNWSNNSVVGYNVYHKLKDLILNDTSPMNRLIKHFSNYVPAHTYSVCRTSIWKVAAQSTFSKEFKFFAAFELQLEFILTYAGKTIVIPELMWMRSGECPPQYGTSHSIIPSLTFFNWWFDEKNKKEKEDFVDRIEFACKEINKLTKEHHALNVEIPFEIYIRSEKNFIFFRFFRYLPALIRSLIKKIFKIFGYDVTKKTLFIDVVKLLEATGVKVNFSELEAVEHSIYSFYENENKTSKLLRNHSSC